MRYEHRCLSFPPGDSPDGIQDGEWSLVYQRQSDDGLFTVWERERKPLGSQLREAQESE